LWCAGNQLTTLNISGCTALENLACGNNQLTELDVTKCTALTSLICENNQLKTLNVSGKTALQQLYCGMNQLTTLNVSGCTVLNYLLCSNNQLTTLDLTGTFFADFDSVTPKVINTSVFWYDYYGDDSVIMLVDKAVAQHLVPDGYNAHDWAVFIDLFARGCAESDFEWVPKAPTNVNASAVGTKNITVTWSKVTQDVEGNNLTVGGYWIGWCRYTAGGQLRCRYLGRQGGGFQSVRL
jgi:hypothetical protein